MAHDHRELIDAYDAGGAKLSQAIRGLTREDMASTPPADANVGKWSIQQVVIHLADSELVMADRMKRVIAEENPSLLAFDENKWVANLRYDDRSAEDAAALVELNRRQMTSVLRDLRADAFERSGTHSETGRKTLADLVRGATSHLDHHVKFIHAKRAQAGKEMW